ncbi:MAG: hypothetical protein ACRCXT_06730 [Paraclostridium sp.]
MNHVKEWSSRDDVILIKGSPKKRASQYQDFEKLKTSVLVVS